MGQLLDAAFQFDVETGQPPVAVPACAQLSTPVGSPVQLDTVNTLSDFSALADEWALLSQNSTSRVSVFQSFTWLRHWVDSYVSSPGSNHQLAIVTGRAADGRLVLVAPFQLERNGLVAHLCWIGCPVAQYGDVLVSSEYDNAKNIREALSVAIQTFKPDVVGLSKVRDDNRLAKALANGWALELCRDTAHELAFGASDRFSEYEKRYSSKSRKNRRRLLRRLQENHKVEFHQHAPGDQAARIAQAGLELKRAWLKSRGLLSAALNQEVVGDLLISLARDPSSGCAVFSVTCDDRIVGVQLGFQHQGKLELYLIVYDLEFEKSGVGSLHLEDTFREACDRGVAVVDLLAPDAVYKREWADVSMGVRDYARPCSLVGRMYMAIYMIGVRKLLKRAQSMLPLKWRKLAIRLVR